MKKLRPKVFQWLVSNVSTDSPVLAKTDNQAKTAHIPSFSRIWLDPVLKKCQYKYSKKTSF